MKISFIEVCITLTILLISASIFLDLKRKETVCKQGVEYFIDGHGYPTSPVMDASTKEPKLCFEKEQQ